MSLFHINYFSQSLAKLTEIYIVAPDDVNELMTKDNPAYDRPAKLLILLHGYSGNAADWVTGSPIREMAGKYNLVVAMPSGDNSFYLNAKHTGGKYQTYIGEELVSYVRKLFNLSDKREDTFIGGFSMGGFGALHTGLEYPETFSRVIALSSANIVEGLAMMPDDNPIANKDYYRLWFGDLEEAAKTHANPRVQLEAIKAEGKIAPAVWMACGTEDFGYEGNKALRDLLKENDIDVTYHEGPGEHNWTFWNSCLEPSLKWLFGIE
ncbi:alpha/beta hydrolase [Butyrivibrio sp. WCD3002]|uniref:alpha/beta hydrolase n=1 Tax=Butyrivibrio sp. WCD3002 TaxID=1280676 RepID=UPI0004197E32|nr:alpha/beta hydrolase family protein [Butyrivibrio sp. WCD3002]